MNTDLPPDIPDFEAGPELRAVAMPADTNPSGDIFGGWVLSQMDLAGGVLATRVARGRVVTVAVEAMKFHKPIKVGDEVSCYAKVVRIGRTSIAIRIETWARRTWTSGHLKVTDGLFTYVAVDSTGRPRPVLP
ncbi:MAG: acyl-CoA thioesterase [Pseudomonadota bacterium]|nr:acyl-CoA thioesterase [Pseudomonadota bacterium]